MAARHPAHLPHVLLLPLLSEGARQETQRVLPAMGHGHPRLVDMVSGHCFKKSRECRWGGGGRSIRQFSSQIVEHLENKRKHFIWIILLTEIGNWLTEFVNQSFDLTQSSL